MISNKKRPTRSAMSCRKPSDVRTASESGIKL